MNTHKKWTLGLCVVISGFTMTNSAGAWIHEGMQMRTLTGRSTSTESGILTAATKKKVETSIKAANQSIQNFEDRCKTASNLDTLSCEKLKDAISQMRDGLARFETDLKVGDLEALTATASTLHLGIDTSLINLGFLVVPEPSAKEPQKGNGGDLLGDVASILAQTRGILQFLNADAAPEASRISSLHDPELPDAGQIAVGASFNSWQFDRFGPQEIDGNTTTMVEFSATYSPSDRFLIYTSLPIVTQARRGDDYPRERETGVGDMRVGGSWWITRPKSETGRNEFDAGVELGLRLPTGSEEFLGYENTVDTEGTGAGFAALRTDLLLAYRPNRSRTSDVHLRIGREWDMVRGINMNLTELALGYLHNFPVAKNGRRRFAAWIDIADTRYDHEMTEYVIRDGVTIEEQVQSMWELRPGIGLQFWQMGNDGKDVRQPVRLSLDFGFPLNDAGYHSTWTAALSLGFAR